MDELKLLQRLTEWFSDDDTTNWTVLDFVYAKGSVIAALWYSRLFWPEFVEIDDMIFLKESVSSPDARLRLAAILDQNRSDLRAVEQAFNSIEAAYLFDKNDTDEDDYVCLMERLVEMWNYRLHSAYPERRFNVELQDADDWNDVRIVFHQR